VTSAALCEAVAGLRFADLPDETVAAARRVLLDATGVMLGASGLSPEVAPFVTLAAGAPGPSAILGTGRRAAAAMAALANGAMAHALDYEDAFDLRPGHPNASLVPALLALAQDRAAMGGPVSGERLLTALVAGCEVACRLGLACGQDMELGHWYPPPIVAGLGAAVGAAKLLGLDARGIRDALSLALCQVTMPGEIKHSPGTVIRAVREAFPAQAAVMAALLARAGVAGFEQPLEGPGGFYALYAGGLMRAEVLEAPLAAPFWIERLTFKPWPSCRGTHPFIELALELRGRHGFAAEDVAEVVCRVDAVQAMLVEPLARKQAPATLIDAKFSVPFCTALALVRGRVTLDTLGEAALGDAEVLELAARVRAEAAGAVDWRRGSGGALAIRLKDGREFSAETRDALGCPDRPLDEARLVAKFVDCAGRAAVPLGEGAAAELAGAILAVESCGDVGALFG